MVNSIRDFITIVDRTHLLCETIYVERFEKIARECSTYEDFLKRTDGEDVLYRGHGGGDVADHSFFTNYLGHATQYGDVVDAYAFDHQDVMLYNDDRFEDMRRAYRRASEWEPDQFAALYRATLHGNRFAPDLDDRIEHVSEVILGDEDIPYSSFSSNYADNDAFIPLMQAYAAEKGKNIIAFNGGDYGEYGGQLEFVVGDLSKLVSLRKLYERIHGRA